MNSPLGVVFAIFHKGSYAVFSFSFCLKYFLISIVIFSLTHVLFESMLLNF